MIAWLIARRNRKLYETNERIRAECRQAFASAGGKAAARKRSEPFREKCRVMLSELGRPVPEVLR